MIEWEERQSAVELFDGMRVSNLGFQKRKPLWKNPPTQPLACLSSLTKEMYADIKVYTKMSAEENARRDRAAVEGRKVVASTRCPVSRDVDNITASNKTLNDVLQNINADYGTTLSFTSAANPATTNDNSSSTRGAPAAADHNRSASAAAQQQLRSKRDFVSMKRYISPAPLIEPVTSDAWMATRSLAAPAVTRTNSAVTSRSMSAASAGAGSLSEKERKKENGGGMGVTLDSHRFAALETRKRAAAIQPSLAEWAIMM